MGYHGQQYYNTKCYKGNCKKTGYAWWYNQSMEDPNNPSHFEEFIPLSLLRSKFGWDAEESVEILAKFVIDGVDYVVPAKRFKAIGRSDWIAGGIPDTEEEGADKILDITNIDYGVHNPKEVFISNVAELFEGGDNIGCESFGELKWGRRLFASFSVPEHLMNSESGLQFRPILTVVTSYDRTLATKYVRTFGIPVCDNTVNYELTRAGEQDGHFVLRHSKNSASRLVGAKQALGLLDQQAAEMDDWIRELYNVEVPEEDFHKWLPRMVPIPDPKVKVVEVTSIQGEKVQTEKKSYHAQTIAMKQHEKLMDMWDTDPRVIGPDGKWRNTRLALFQLWNTYQQYETGVKATKALGATDNEQSKEMARVNARIEKNMDRMTNVNGDGSFLKTDLKALNVMAEIQAEKVSVPVSKKQKADA